MEPLVLDVRTSTLVTDPTGQHQWREQISPCTIEPSRTALLLCDVWDDHTSRGAVQRLEAMIPAMAAVVKVLRSCGVTIVHCPSDCMGYYAGSQARQRVLDTPVVTPPPDRQHDDPPLPIDTQGPFSDTDEPTWKGASFARSHNWYDGRSYPWQRQHPGVDIDHSRDGISDQGPEVYSFLMARGITRVLVMGVHTNMCVLHRTFGIKQLIKWGIDCILLRDLTDAMYSPARPPYVSHDVGTDLVIQYIEKFWCPSALGAQILSLQRRQSPRWNLLRSSKL